MRNTILILAIASSACGMFTNIPEPPPPYTFNTNNINQALPDYNPPTTVLPVQGSFQQGIGDCWFMAALIALDLRDQNTLLERITIENPNDALVSFYDANRTIYVEDVEYAQIEDTVNDFPNDDNWSYFFEQGLINFNDVTHTINPNNGDLGITGGVPIMAWNVLTDQNSYSVSTQDPNLWALLTGTSTPMAADTMGTATSDGNYIVTDHSYTVVGAGLYQGTQAVMLRNPWGINWYGGMGDQNQSNHGIVIVPLSTFIANFGDVEFLVNK